MSKRAVKHVLLWVAKYLGLFWASRRITRRGISIIGWHGVSLTDEHTRMPKFFISQERLRRRLEYLTRYYKVISLDEALRQHAAGRIEPGQVVLTFDDGMYNFAARAVPLLKSHEVPATLYAISATLSELDVAHNMLAREVLLLAEPMEVPATVPDLGGRSLQTCEEREACTALARKALGRIPRLQERTEFVRQMANDLGVDLEEIMDERVWHYLTADELKELAEEGFDIQAHSHVHRTVTSDPDAVYEDTALCKELLEETIGKPIRDYCYPSGRWEHRAWEALTAAGMRSAVTCKLGPNFAKTPPLALRRYIDSQGISELEFESLVSGFRWLLHVMLHPRRIFEPSESHSETTTLFSLPLCISFVEAHGYELFRVAG